MGLDEDKVFIAAPSGGRFLQRVFRDLGVRSSDRLLDIGCAKGSALRRLLPFPFAKTDGIELAPALAVIARRNFAKLKQPQVQIFCLDARSFARYGDNAGPDRSSTGQAVVRLQPLC